MVYLEYPSIPKRVTLGIVLVRAQENSRTAGVNVNSVLITPNIIGCIIEGDRCVRIYAVILEAHLHEVVSAVVVLAARGSVPLNS
jgi:hypothetical protein